MIPVDEEHGSYIAITSRDSTPTPTSQNQSDKTQVEPSKTTHKMILHDPHGLVWVGLILMFVYWLFLLPSAQQEARKYHGLVMAVKELSREMKATRLALEAANAAARGA